MSRRAAQSVMRISAERQHRDGEFRRGDEIHEQIVGSLQS